MTPIKYCENKVYQRGTSLFYSLLYAHDPLKSQFIIIFAFRQEIENVLIECSDTSVARMKLSWWKNEVDKAWQSQPATHPILQAMQSDDFNLTQHSWAKNFLIQIIESVEMDLSQSRYMDWQGLDNYLTLNGSACAQLCVHLAYGEALKQFAIKIGKSTLFTQTLRNIGLDAQHGRIYIPIDDLRKFDIKANQILKNETGAEFNDLFRHLAHRNQEMYKEALELLPQTSTKEQIKALRPIFIFIALNQALLKKLIKKPTVVLEQYYSLTPIKKLLIAYRHKNWAKQCIANNK